MKLVAFMALLSAAPLAAQSAAPAPTPRPVDPKVAQQVTVIAGKLRDWQGAWGAAGGKLACRTVKSTGDTEIDMIGCGALIGCIKPAYPELKAIADGAGSEADKKSRMGAKIVSLDTCFKQHRGQGIAVLALKRGED